jgi:phosphate transport system permease protein
LVSSKLIDNIVKNIFLVCAASSIVIVFGIFIYIFYEATPQLQSWLLHGFGMTWIPYGDMTPFGIIPASFYTLYTGVGATILSALVGIPCAIYLAEYATPKARNFIKPSLEVLTSLPSIIVGLIGVVVIVGMLQNLFDVGSGKGLVAAWLVLFVMILPLVASITEDAIRAVPNELREASLALGATKWQTTQKVSLPGAKSGMLTSLVLAMGTAVGETMAVWMVVGGGFAPTPPPSLTYFFGNLDTIPIEIALSYKGGESGGSTMAQCAAAAVILFLIVGILNIAIRKTSKGTKNIG